jgi:hypothetical protein
MSFFIFSTGIYIIFTHPKEIVDKVWSADRKRIIAKYFHRPILKGSRQTNALASMQLFNPFPPPPPCSPLSGIKCKTREFSLAENTAADSGKYRQIQHKSKTVNQYTGCMQSYPSS